MSGLRIRTRLLISFATLLLLMGGGDWLAVNRMRSMHETTDRIVQSRFEKVLLAQRGVALVNENSRRAFELFLISDKSVPDKSKFAQVFSEQVETTRQITNLYRDFEPTLETDRERALFATIKKARGEYVAARTVVEKTLDAGHRDEAMDGLQRTVLPKLALYLGAWRTLLDYEGVLAKEAASDAAVKYESARNYVLLLLLASVAFALVVAAGATRAITEPLKRIAAAARQLERGESMDPIQLRAKDEFWDLAKVFNVMGDAVSHREKYLRGEMDLAQRLQTSLLPRKLAVRGFELSGQMEPASEVGGDYYDVLPTEDGFWLGIGDVAGHGLNAGLVMMMVQTTVAALVSQNPNASPKDILCSVNAVLFENIRYRLRRDEHVTLTLLRCHQDGRVVFAGAHEDILISRQASGEAEWIATPGTWVGGMRDISTATRDRSLQLLEGDIMLLYTDGITEARNAKGKMYGPEGLSSALPSIRTRDLKAIGDHVMTGVREWRAQQDDDTTILIARYMGATLSPVAPPAEN